jgi:hypothetical protein
MARAYKGGSAAAGSRYYWTQQGQWKNVDKHLRKAYGITAVDYAWMENEQDRKCKICATDYTETRNQRLVVDHCHDTGKVRGLLCHKCNAGHGQYNDNLTIMSDSAAYVATHRSLTKLIQEAASWHE